MKLIVDSLERSTESAKTFAQFGKRLTKLDVEMLKTNGFSSSRVRSASCMGWQWCQWLQGGLVGQVRDNVGAFVERGMDMQAKSTHFRMRAVADLYLLHCAIFASNSRQLEKLASRVVDATGFAGRKPEEKAGELYASAWCGMLKYWILGDLKEAERQSESIWSAYRCPSFAAATKPLVMPWLKGDWNGFVKAQRMDYEKLWARARKDGTVRSETADEIVVTVQRYPIEQKWCWAHCGLALLAYRRGVEVVTNPFWFPAHALMCVDAGK